MNNIRATLATVWRIASPYFRSEDRWAGRGLLAAVIAIELSLVAIDVLINQWQNRFFNALQACFSMHQLNHAYWAVEHDDGYPIAKVGTDVPDWRGTPLKPSLRDSV